MVVHSSEGFNGFFTPQMPSEFFEFPNQSSEMNELMLPLEFYNNLIEWDLLLKDNWKAEKEKTKPSDAGSGLTDPQIRQSQLNQAEPSEASSRKKSEGGRVKLTPDQIRENEKQSDYKYRQKLKRTAAEQSAENEHLKKENEELNAENKKLKGLLLMRYGQLPEETLQRQGQDNCIAQSTSELLDHPTVSVQETEENLATENNLLKVETERLDAEIRQLKVDVRRLQPSPLQLQSEAGQNCCVSKSVSHLLNHIHKGVFVQVATVGI